MSSSASAVAAQKVLEAFRTGAIFRAAQLVFVPQALAEDAPCRQWSLRNRLFAALSGSADARTFRQWLACGRAVCKGEKARAFIFLPVFKRQAEAQPREALEAEAGEPCSHPLGFYAKLVFGYHQTDGEPMAAYQQQAGFLKDLPLIEVAQAWGVPVRVAAGLAETGALGMLRHQERLEGARILLAVENPEVFLHELVHTAELRRGSLRPGREERPGKEIVAELGAQMLLAALGRPPVSDTSYAYLARYAEKLKLTPEQAALRFLERTASAVEMILQAAEEVRQEAQASPWLASTATPESLSEPA